ncbi:MAG TPA: chloride channel protein [Candidatus Saccharimonadales bacterium]|nr:chloride channel protein [Candidatus Saccharimonadales bacterium]
MTEANLDDASRLGDFTMSPGSLRLIPLGVGVGVIAAFIALILLDLIGLFTNLFYYGRLSVSLVSPAANQIGLLALIIPVAGGLVIGVMARYGSERIRGHGIPEAMETILVGGSKVEPRLAVLKPISSAISIGTGGPFGAEGPIIMTGGAFGSLVGQFFRLTAAERKTLLVAGAAAGMTAVFGTPVASVLLAVELLLFELKPRSLVPTATAVAVAAAIRLRFANGGLIAPVPLFPVPPHALLDESGLLSALVVGIAGGFLAWVLTVAVYGAEDAFKHIPIHWMWWPAIGGVVIGIGGLIEPHALGVGYDSIAAELGGQLALGSLVSLLVVKLVIWSIALGSGTSGGILAPLLLIGGALGGIMAPVLPGGSVAIWCLIGMAATMAGVTRSPLTSIVFAFELTHDANALLPLLIACAAADTVSVLVLKRSILTEKVARRGFHVMREYSVEPLEALFVREVMTTHVLTVDPGRPAAELAAQLRESSEQRRQRLYPVIGPDQRMQGVVGRRDVESVVGSANEDALVSDIMRRDIVVGYPDETLRSAADRMSERGVGVLPVVERKDRARLLGLVTQFDLLRARDRLVNEERHRERILRVRLRTEAPDPLRLGPRRLLAKAAARSIFRGRVRP